jgi:site-specific DNA-cytosine methylase
MRVIVGCEFSQIVALAFRNKGHEAFSCDLLPTEGKHPEWHFREDILEVLKREKFDLGIFHPPCTHLAVSGARWFKEKQKDGRQQEGINFFLNLTVASIDKIAIENPVGIMSRKYRRPDQIIQPYYFGDSVQKATCLWLKNLPKLQPTKIVDRGLIYVDPRGNKHGGVHTMLAKRAYSPLMSLAKSEEKWKIRSRTFQGVAEAMASQWS